MRHYTVLLTIIVSLLISRSAFSQPIKYDSVIKHRLLEIRHGLDTMIMVRRFESIQTPCVCISDDDNIAYSPSNPSNSNFRTTVKKKKMNNGINCLSQYCARYCRFKVKEVDLNALTITGGVELTYGYPAAAIIQYLGKTYKSENPQNDFFENLLRSQGSFKLYPENDKYILQLTLETQPYDRRDTFYAYLEIVRGVYEQISETGYMLFFDQMSLHKGDRNSQIFLRFTSTSIRDETIYYTNLLYDKLVELTGTKTVPKKEAMWVQNFFGSPGCNSCHYLYSKALSKLEANGLRLPDTDPFPAH
jgi:hypothetical protein